MDPSLRYGHNEIILEANEQKSARFKSAILYKFGDLSYVFFYQYGTIYYLHTKLNTFINEDQGYIIIAVQLISRWYGTVPSNFYLYCFFEENVITQFRWVTMFLILQIIESPSRVRQLQYTKSQIYFEQFYTACLILNTSSILSPYFQSIFENFVSCCPSNHVCKRKYH